MSLENIKKEYLELVKDIKNEKELYDLRVKFLGKKGALTEIMKGARDLSPEERPTFGKLVNEVKTFINESLEERKVELAEKALELKLASENISKNDLESYNAWIFAEKNVFSNNMLDKLDEIRDNSKKYDLSIKNNIIQIFSNELLKVFIYFIVLIPLLYRPKKIFGHLSLVMPIALIVLLSIRQRMVERVYIPLIVIFIFSFIIYLQDIFEKRNYRLLRGTENIIFSILSLIMLNNAIQYGTDNLYWFVHQSFPHNKVYNELLKNNEKNLYIFAGYGNIINSQPNVSKVFVEKDKLTKNMLTLGNWQTFTPQYKEKLDDLNVSDSNNLLSSALDSDNIKFVLPEKSGLMEKVKTLFKEHYNKDVNFIFQEKVDEEVNVYVLRSDVSE